MPLDDVVEKVLQQAIDDLNLKSRVGSYYNDPVAFAKDVLGIELWSKQREMVESVQHNTHTIVRSCHGSGKSLTSSVIICWWITTRPVGSAIAVTTAPTYAQVHAILWEEIRKHHANAQQRYEEGKSPIKLPGYITQSDQWKSDSGILLGFGRKPADSNEHGFQGIHRRYVLAVIDEACGINEGLYTAIEAITNTGDARVLAVGNPDDPASHMGDIFRKDPTWNKIGISAFDSPNFTIRHVNDPTSPYFARAQMDKDINEELRPYLIQHDWVEHRRIAWGESSPRWKSKVLGEFPDVSVNTLFDIYTLTKGQNTECLPSTNTDLILGVDVARMGIDYSTIYSYQEGVTRSVKDEFIEGVDEPGGEKKQEATKKGGLLRFVKAWSKTDAVESAKIIHQTALEMGANEVRIDSEGFGAGITDQVRIMAQTTYRVVAMKGSAASPDRFHWLNARAFWHDDLRQRMYDGKIDIDGLDSHLEEELGMIQYHFKNRHKSLQIESKDEMASRGVKSPDYSDAAVYASADLGAVANDPFAGFLPGDRISLDAADFLGLMGRGELIGPY